MEETKKGSKKGEREDRWMTLEKEGTKARRKKPHLFMNCLLDLFCKCGLNMSGEKKRELVNFPYKCSQAIVKFQLAYYFFLHWLLVGNSVGAAGLRNCRVDKSCLRSTTDLTARTEAPLGSAEFALYQVYTRMRQ